MSLRAFHIIFILASICLSVGFGYWCVDIFFLEEKIFMLWVAMLSLVAAIGLSIYLFWFLRKLKGLQVGLLSFVLAGFYPCGSYACSVCYGDPNSPMTKSANMGTFFLLGVVAVVLSGFAVLFISWTRRIQRLSP